MICWICNKTCNSESGCEILQLNAEIDEQTKAEKNNYEENDTTSQ